MIFTYGYVGLSEKSNTSKPQVTLQPRQQCIKMQGVILKENKKYRIEIKQNDWQNVYAPKRQMVMSDKSLPQSD